MIHLSSPLHSGFSQLSTKGDTLLLGTNRAFPVNIMRVVFAKPALTHLDNLQRLSLFLFWPSPLYLLSSEAPGGLFN